MPLHSSVNNVSLMTTEYKKVSLTMTLKRITIAIFILHGLASFAKSELSDELNQILAEIDQNKNINNPIGNSNPPRSPLDPYTEENNRMDNGNDNNNHQELFQVSKNVECTDKCVPFYQCNNGSIVTNGESLIDIRLNDGPCGNAFLTCCKLQYVTSHRFLQQTSKVPTPNGCGYRNPDGIGFKITGNKENEAQFAEFPWMVSIIKNGGPQVSNPRPSCGGALIHVRAVITAAHCVSDKKQSWRVRAGEWDINRTIEPIPHQEVYVQAIRIHQRYYSGSLYNDIAFLYLETAIKIAENAAPICLPPQNYHHRPMRCFSTGWGKDRFGKLGQYHVIMKKIDLPVVPFARCQGYLRKTRLGRYFKLHPSFMCAGGEKGKDVCNGDGGSPLVCPIEGEKNRFYQAGIVAWGIGCGDENVPGVYVDVAKFRYWIDEAMKQFHLQVSSYVADNPDIN